MENRLLTALIGLVIAACTGSATDDPKTEKIKSTEENNESWNPWGCCELIAKRPLAWTEVGSFGVSPEQAFSSYEGSCHAPFRWGQSTCFDQMTIYPEESRGSVETDISVEHQSAVLIESKSEEGVDCGCGRQIEIPARVAFRTSDGLFQEERSITLIRYEHSQMAEGIGWSIATDGSNPLIRAQSKVADAEVHIGLSVSPVQEDCAGSIGVTMVKEEKDGLATAWTCGNVAIWSNKGCVGYEGIDPGLNENYDEIMQKITEVWKEVTYEGTWDDGATTQFQLAVIPNAQSACVQYYDEDGPYDFLVPVQVTSNTSDGRILNVTGVGNVLVRVQPGWSISLLDLWMSEDVECDSHFDLNSQSISCSQVDHVTAELSIDHDPNVSTDNEGTGEYRVYLKASDGTSQTDTLKADLTFSIQLASQPPQN